MKKNHLVFLKMIYYYFNSNMSNYKKVKIDKDTIIDISLSAYWEFGINGISFNNIVRKSNISKTRMYNLFKSEDGLKSATLSRWDELYGKIWRESIEKSNNIFQLLKNLYEGIATGKHKTCFFSINRLEKHNLGLQTKRIILRIENNFINSWSNCIRNNTNIENKDIKTAANYLFLQQTIFNVVKKADMNKKDIISMSKFVIKSLKNNYSKC